MSADEVFDLDPALPDDEFDDDVEVEEDADIDEPGRSGVREIATAIHKSVNKPSVMRATHTTCNKIPAIVYVHEVSTDRVLFMKRAKLHSRVPGEFSLTDYLPCPIEDDQTYHLHDLYISIDIPSLGLIVYPPWNDKMLMTPNQTFNTSESRSLALSPEAVVFRFNMKG